MTIESYEFRDTPVTQEESRQSFQRIQLYLNDIMARLGGAPASGGSTAGASADKMVLVYEQATAKGTVGRYISFDGTYFNVSEDSGSNWYRVELDGSGGNSGDVLATDGAAVSWRPGPIRKTYSGNNDPTGTDDEGQGYGAGSLGLNTTTEEGFLCVNPAPDDNAVWKNITNTCGAQKTVTAAHTAGLAEQTLLCDATGGAFTVTLPGVGSAAGHIYNIKKIDSSANVVTITAA